MHTSASIHGRRRAIDRLLAAGLWAFLAVALTIDLSALIGETVSPIARVRELYASLCDPLYASMPRALRGIHLAHLGVMVPLAVASLAALRSGLRRVPWAPWAFACVGLAVDAAYYVVELTASQPPTNLPLFLALTLPYPLYKLALLARLLWGRRRAHESTELPHSGVWTHGPTRTRSTTQTDPTGDVT